MKPALSRLIFARSSPDLAELPHVRGSSLTESAENGGLRSFAAIGHCVNRKTTERKESAGEGFALKYGFKKIEDKLLLVSWKMLARLDPLFNFAFRPRLGLHRFRSDEFVS